MPRHLTEPLAICHQWLNQLLRRFKKPAEGEPHSYEGWIFGAGRLDDMRWHAIAAKLNEGGVPSTGMA